MFKLSAAIRAADGDWQTLFKVQEYYMTNLESTRQTLAASKLVSAETVDKELAAWGEEYGGQPAGEDLVDWLVNRDLITEFQAEAILAGHSGPYVLGPYEVQELITAGRLGALFRARHTEFDQPVSLKVFPSSLADNEEQLARMGREARVAIEIDHPNVVRSFQVGKIGDTYYLALEDLQGEMLSTRLEREGRLSCNDACRIARDVARGLDHLHGLEIIHRDVRPANIWITPAGQPKILEFGAARDALAYLDGGGYDAGLTTSETVLGMYDYMASEQADDARSADARSDIYSLGCTLYHCLTGRPPFTEKNPVKQVLKHATAAPPRAADLCPDLPAGIDDTLAGMLSKRPDDRFQKASEVAYALDAFVEHEPEQITVLPVSEEYLAWVGGKQTSSGISETAEGVTPELSQFLDWMGARQARRKKKDQKKK